ncbi:toxin-antitoxin system, toxin component [Streptomyces sp. NPDC058001]|uniref:toxin-antitoxin system, toxin component n=1 Tax=Streptomyces sp. NPDC058001 TaxID=3346300 RepID=UPI0036E66A0B
MRHLIDRLDGGLGLPVRTEGDALFDALIADLSRIRGREVTLVKEEFPHRTASGLWLDLPGHDLIVVDRRATPLHQLAIFFHEVWHMVKGDCGGHAVGKAVAARMLSARADIPGLPDLPQLQEAVLKVAARTEFDSTEEADAERFGLLAVTRFRVRLEGGPEGVPTDRRRIAGRIGASLGHRRPRV